MTITPRLTVFLITLMAIGTIGGAFFFEFVLRYAPCQLCLWQRWPWYAAIALGAAGLLLPGFQRWALLGLGVLMLISIGLGVYHAGVEWEFWKGPAGCSAGVALPSSAGGLLGAMNETRLPSCTEAAWTLWGISLAGWNVLVSALAFGFIAIAARPTRSVPNG
jgi:disulfide bond formation protein DsbB